MGNLLGFSNPSGLGVTTNNLDPMIGILSNSINNPLYPDGGGIGGLMGLPSPMNPLFQVLSLLSKKKSTTNEISDTDPTIKATVNEEVLSDLMNSKAPKIIGNLYSDQEDSILLTEGHLRGAKLSKKLLSDVKKVADKYKVDPYEILAIAGKESTFGYGESGGTRRENGNIDAKDLFTYNDAHNTPAKSYLQYLYENKGDKRVGVDKNFHGIDFYVKPLGKKAEDDNFIEMYNDEKLMGEYKKYLDSVPKAKDLNVLEEVAKRIKTKGISSYNPGQKNYAEMVNQYKEMLLKNKTPIEFSDGGSVGDIFDFELDALSKVITQRNSNLDWIQRAINPNDYPSITNEDGTTSTHKLMYRPNKDGTAYVFPSIIQNSDGKLLQFDNEDGAFDYAEKTKTLLKMPTIKLAEYYSKNGLINHLKNGGEVEQAKGGGFFGKILKGLGSGADGLLSNLGLGNVIKNSGYDAAVEKHPIMGKLANISSGILGAGLNFALPGVGTAFSLGKGLLNNSGVSSNSSNTSGFDFGYKESDSSPNYNYGSLLSGLTPVFNNPMFNGNKGIGAGVNPLGGLLSQMGSGTNQNNLIQLLQGLSGGKTPTFTGQPMYMEEGGEVQMSPIQTEKGEYLIHLDNSITKTNATKKHSKMDKDEVTDVVPENTFVASADKKSSIKKKEVEDIVLGVKTMPYEEAKQGKIPEKILFSDIFKNNKMTPAELTKAVMEKYEVIDKSDEFNKNDVFTKLTNKENMDERAIWLNVIKVLNEDKKNGTNSFKKGGEIDMYPKGGTVAKNGNIPHYDLGDWVGILGSAAPLLANIFGKGNSDKTAQNIALGSIPLHTLGLTNNINAQKAAYGTAISDFTGLGQNLNNFALGQAGANIAGRLSQDTSYGRFDPTTQDARLANFNTRTPNSFIDALTPKVDYGTLASTLGARGFNSAVGNIAGNQIEGRNTAAINAFNQDRSLGLNILGQRNNLDSFSQQFNLGQREKQQAAENSQKAGIFGDISSLQGRLGDIQSQILPITTQFNLQRAGLEGQIPMGIAQNAQSIAALIAMNNAQNGTGGSNSGGNQNLINQLLQKLSPSNTQLQGVKNNVSTQNLNQNKLDFSSLAKLLQRPLSSVNISPLSQQDPDCYNGVSITTGMPC